MRKESRAPALDEARVAAEVGVSSEDAD